MNLNVDSLINILQHIQVRITTLSDLHEPFSKKKEDTMAKQFAIFSMVSFINDKCKIHNIYNTIYVMKGISYIIIGLYDKKYIVMLYERLAVKHLKH